MQINEIDILFDYICNISKKKIMFDVGACRGVTLKPFLLDSWDVYAFEPDKNNYKFLEEIKKQYKKLKIFDYAVSDSNKSGVPFYTSDISSGISGLHNFHSTHKETNKVNTITLKYFCDEHNIKEIDFLKIDTEGLDFFVLKGIPWEKIKPNIILCEFEDRKTKSLGYDFNDMAYYLEKMNYKLLISEWHPIIEYGKKHSWNKFKIYPCRLENENSWGNILAFHKTLNWEILINSIIKSFEDEILILKNKNSKNLLRKIYKKILKVLKKS